MSITVMKLEQRPLMKHCQKLHVLEFCVFQLLIIHSMRTEEDSAVMSTKTSWQTVNFQD